MDCFQYYYITIQFSPARPILSRESLPGFVRPLSAAGCRGASAEKFDKPQSSSAWETPSPGALHKLPLSVSPPRFINPADYLYHPLSMV
jgi:hypothetical protein